MNIVPLQRALAQQLPGWRVFHRSSGSSDLWVAQRRYGTAGLELSESTPAALVESCRDLDERTKEKS